MAAPRAVVEVAALTLERIRSGRKYIYISGRPLAVGGRPLIPGDELVFVVPGSVGMQHAARVVQANWFPSAGEAAATYLTGAEALDPGSLDNEVVFGCPYTRAAPVWSYSY